MQNVVYKPFVPSGEVTVPPSKSDVHRAIICAALAKGNFYGTQFHPEKSGDIGEAILRNFLKL